MPITRSAENARIPTPPRQARTGSPTVTKAAMARAEDERREASQKRVDSLNEIASVGHLVLLALRQPADAAAVNRHAPRITLAMVDYAETSGKTEWIDRLSDISPLAGVGVAVVPLLLQVCVNHNILGMKAEQFADSGVVSKDTLISETNAYLMDVQARAMRKQMEKEAELRQVAAEYEQMQKQYANEPD